MRALQLAELNVKAQSNYEEGLEAHRRGQIALAQQLYRQSITLQSNHFEALHLLGVVAAQQRCFREAVALISRSIEINPYNAVAHANLGNALTDLGQYEAAV
jgi:tetratricopeptide (TPR) repeat protein